MYIKTEHFATTSTGSIDAEQTLSNSLNDYIGDLNSRFKIMSVGFKMSHDESCFFSFRIKIKLIGYKIEDELSKLQEKLGLMNPRLAYDRLNGLLDVYLEDNNSIMQLLHRMEYRSSLTDMTIPSSRRVDLLQVLMTQVISNLIVARRITPHAPRDIEFDHLGNLSATLTSPKGVEFKLKTTEEVMSFLRQYCHASIPAPFLSLCRAQMTTNMARFINYLAKPNADLIPHIFMENQLTSVQLIEEKKMLSCGIKRRNEMSEAISIPERRIFQQLLQEALGGRFALKWKSVEEEYQLVLSAKDTPLIETDVAHLNETLMKYRLLTHEERALISIEKLIGPTLSAYYTMSSDIEDILSCKITYTLLQTAMITPNGHTVEKAAIDTHLMTSHSDPFTRGWLASSQLRPNRIVSQLIAHFTDVTSSDPNITPPLCLLDPLTGQFYNHPVVNESGETVEGTAFLGYPNRLVSELIAYYKSELCLIENPVTRSKVRSTIGANIGMLCPGVGSLTRAEAEDETNCSVPYPEFDSTSETLHVYFISKEYARRLEVGLRLWIGEGLHFSDSHVNFEPQSIEKMIVLVNEQTRTMHFQARLSITSESSIRLFLEKFCGLSPDYFSLLRDISSSGLLDVFNHLMKDIPLGDWETVLDHEAFNAPSSGNNILSMRAHSDSMRMAGPLTFYGQRASSYVPSATLTATQELQEDVDDDENEHQAKKIKSHHPFNV